MGAGLVDVVVFGWRYILFLVVLGLIFTFVVI